MLINRSINTIKSFTVFQFLIKEKKTLALREKPVQLLRHFVFFYFCLKNSFPSCRHRLSFFSNISLGFWHSVYHTSTSPHGCCEPRPSTVGSVSHWCHFELKSSTAASSLCTVTVWSQRGCCWKPKTQTIQSSSIGTHRSWASTGFNTLHVCRTVWE